VPVPNTLLTARFSDGSGNHYSFDSEGADSVGHLVYKPVTPEQSSSGVYSGGEPADVALSVEQNAELWKRLATLHANEAIHAQSRAMGTGAFDTNGPEGAVRFVIRMGPELSEFVAFVEQLRR
jgi:hypothetical protein